MMKDDQIEKGDLVQVSFNNSQFTLCQRAEVLGMPYSTGDSWRLKELSSGTVHYISEGVHYYIGRESTCKTL